MQQDRPAAAVYRGRQKGSGNEIHENFLLHAILSSVSTIQNTTKTKETSGEVQKKKKKANSNDVELSREAKLYIAHAQAGAANEITRVRGQRGKTKKKKKRRKEMQKKR